RESLSGAVFGRPTPTSRYRSRARARAEAARARRARLGARRVDSRRSDQLARAPQGRAVALVSVRRARLVRGAAPRRPRRGDVPRQNRGARRRRRGVPTARPPIHAGVALGDSATRSADRATPPAYRARRRSAEPCRSAVGLPISHSLPEIRARARRRAEATLRGGVAAARSAHGRRRSRRRVSLRGRRAGALSYAAAGGWRQSEILGEIR